MSKPKQRKPNYISSIVSTAFVLFAIGLFAFFLVKANQIVQQLKEKIEIVIFIEEGTTPQEISSLESELQAEPYTKNVYYISKEQAKEEFSQTYDMDVLDYNPLPASFNFTVYAQYATPVQLKEIKQQLERQKAFQSVYYQENLVDIVNTNIKKIGIVLSIIALFFLFMAISLIDTTIRLSLFSQRFLIKSMQLVGAKPSFILRPYLWRGFRNGLISALLAISLLYLLYFGMKSYLPIIEWKHDLYFIISIAIGILILGILISVLATWQSVSKYLKQNIEDLY